MIHFIGGYNQSGKSWFVRALAETIAAQSDRVIVVDASLDKKLGMVYSPTFNRYYDIRFSAENSLALDPLLEYGNDWQIVVKIPADAHQLFVRWLHEVTDETMPIDCCYWFISRGKDDYPPEILEIFKERCFLVENQYYLANFQLFKQPEFVGSAARNENRQRRIKLPALTRDPVLIDCIERSGLSLSAFSERSNIINRSRIYRFLEGVREPLAKITRNLHRDRKCRDREPLA